MTTQTSKRLLLTLAEVMQMIPRSRSELYREMNAGRLAYIQAGTRRLFEPAAIDAYIATLKAASGGVERLLELVDVDGRLDIAALPDDATLADLAEVKRLLAARAA